MLTDGQDLPWQMLWGYDCKPTSLTIRIPFELRDPLYQLCKCHWLSKIDASIQPEVPYPEHPSLFRFSNITFDVIPEKAAVRQSMQINNVDAFCAEFALDNWESIVCTPSVKPSDIPTPPGNSFADLIYLYGLTHSTGTWDKDAVFMMERLAYDPSDLIAFSDDIYQYMLDHDFTEKDAWKAAEDVKCGHGLPFFSSGMLTAKDKWVLPRCDAIQYLFPKAHAVEHIFLALKTGAFSSE